jgi:flavin-binding protein dodecin
MAESVYKVIELVGTSTQSWEKAAAAAVNLASRSLRDLRVAEVSQLDMHIVDGKIVAYRAKVKVSFKYVDTSEGEAATPAEPKRAARRAKPAPEPEEEEAAPKKAPRGRKKKA